MSFEFQYIASFVLSLSLFIWFWYRLLNANQSADLSAIESCAYCSNIAVTTWFDEDVEEQVEVCQNHLEQFLD